MDDTQAIRTKGPEEFDFVAIVTAIWRQKWLVLISTAISFVVGVAFALFWPRTFEAVATVFPMSSSSSSTLSEYAGLATLAGINLPTTSGGNNPGKTVNALLGSRLLVEKLVADLSLLEVIAVGGKNSEERSRNLVNMLRKSLKYREDPKTGVISVSFELADAALAQRLTNHLLTILDTLLVEKSFTTNRKKQEQLGRQIREQGSKLSDYQRQMAEFQKETTLLNPTAQAGKAVDAYITMIQQKMELELQLATAQTSYSSDNPRVTLLQTQIKNLESQIDTVKNQVNGDLPSLKMAPENMIRYQNLARDLEIATKIYAGLLASLEQSKLENDKDQVYIEVLDKALLPIEGKPSRSIVVAGATVLGGVLSILVVLLIVGLRRTKEFSVG